MQKLLIVIQTHQKLDLEFIIQTFDRAALLVWLVNSLTEETNKFANLVLLVVISQILEQTIALIVKQGRVVVLQEV